MTTRDRVRIELGRDEIATLQQIGERIGITREYVRILGKEMGFNFRSRRRAATEAKEAARKRLPKGSAWTALIRSWLRQIGYGYCCTCHAAKPLFQMVPQGKNRNPVRCGACTAMNVKRMPSQQPEALKAYAAAHRDQCREHSRNYYYRNLERIKAKGEAALAEYRAKNAAYHRDRYKRIRAGATPEKTSEVREARNA